MNQFLLSSGDMTELTPQESAAIVGGGQFAGSVQCEGITLAHGNGGIRTLILGLGLFGVARMAGMVTALAFR